MRVELEKKKVNSKIAIDKKHYNIFDGNGVPYEKLYLEQKRKFNDLVDKLPQLIKKVLREAKQSGKLNLKNIDMWLEENS
jgi:hypothetical protein